MYIQAACLCEVSLLLCGILIRFNHMWDLVMFSFMQDIFFHEIHGTLKKEQWSICSLEFQTWNPILGFNRTFWTMKARQESRKFI